MKLTRAQRESLQLATKTITYTAAGTGLAGAATAIFTVTGQVLIQYLVPYCTVNLTESAGTPTLALGVVGNTAIFLGATTATAIDAGFFWLDTSPAEVGAMALPAALTNIVTIANVQCLVGGTNNISAGAIRYDVWWRPLSSDGNVAAA
jgi:hypothetical protein